MTTSDRTAPSRLVLAAGGVLNVGVTAVMSAVTIYALYLATTLLHPIFVIPLIGACIITCIILPTLAYGHVAAVIRGRLPGA